MKNIDAAELEDELLLKKANRQIKKSSGTDEDKDTAQKAVA